MKILIYRIFSMYLYILFLVAFLFEVGTCGVPASASAATYYYVSPSGLDTNAGTRASPFKTITKAASVATAGDTVHVAPGTYAEDITITTSGTASSRIRFVSDTKWGAKIIPSTAAHDDIVWKVNGDYVDIEGFDISASGHQEIASLIFIYGSFDHVMNNHAHDMPVTSAHDCAPGGAILTQGDPGKQDTEIIGNFVHNIGSGACWFNHCIYTQMPGDVIANNLIYNCSAFGIHRYHTTSNSTVINNTIFKCGAYGMVFGTDHPDVSDYNTVANNIIYNNSMGGIWETLYNGTHNLYTNNLVYNNNGNDWALGVTPNHPNTIAADPQFVNYNPFDTGDYHLKSTSPAIDKGTSSNAPATDLDGTARPQGAGYDIGAYEYKNSAPPPACITAGGLDPIRSEDKSHSHENGNIFSDACIGKKAKGPENSEKGE